MDPPPTPEPMVKGATPDEYRKAGARAWGVRYGQEVDGVRPAGEEALWEMAAEFESPDFPRIANLKPGTREFAALHYPKAEPVIERMDLRGRIVEVTPDTGNMGA